MISRLIFLLLGFVLFHEYGRAQTHVKISGKPKAKEISSNQMDSLSQTINRQADQQASYPGGAQALNQFIMKEQKYPETCIENGIQGRVYVKFVVEADGSITSVAVIRSVHPLLDAEAIRLILSMPKWIPARCGDRTCRSSITLPLNFAMV